MAERTGGRVRSGGWIAALVLAATVGGCHPMDNLLHSVFGRSMRQQPAIQPYQNPLPPPQGSVPFASGNFPAAPGDFAIGQAEGTAAPPPVTPLMVLLDDPLVVGLENPIAPSAESLARGEVMFNRACVPCHGSAGAGDGLVTRAGVLPVSIVTDSAAARTDGTIYSVIRVGRGAMPAYGHQLSHFDRWHVVNYVRQLQGAAAPEPAGQDD